MNGKAPRIADSYSENRGRSTSGPPGGGRTETALQGPRGKFVIIRCGFHPGNLSFIIARLREPTIVDIPNSYRRGSVFFVVLALLLRTDGPTTVAEAATPTASASTVRPIAEPRGGDVDRFGRPARRFVPEAENAACRRLIPLYHRI